MFGASKLVALILAFTLGFSCAGGILIGGVAIALGSFRVRDLEKYEIMEIPDELFMEENPKTDLLNLTAFEMFDEMKRLYKLGDGVTINYLQSEYGLKLPSAAQKFLTDEAREMPLKSLFSEAGVKSLLATVYIGYVQSFECHALDSTEPADPALGKEGARWYNPTTGKYVTGINETLAFISLGDFVSGKVDVTAIIGGVHIGEALGYYSKIDENGKEVWCDGTTGEPVTGIIGVFAGCKVDEVGDKLNNVKIGELLGYTQDAEGKWFEKDENGDLVPVDGFMKILADSTMDTVGNDIEEAKLGDLLGYYYDETDARWEEDSESDTPVSGFMKILADCTMDNVGEEIEKVKLGDLFGYYYDEEQARWEEDAETDTAVTGFMKILADCTMDTVGDEIEKSKLGDLLGYEYDEEEDIWKDAETHEDVTGFMKILADSTMDDVGDNIEDAYLGDLFGYHTKAGEDGWFEYDEHGNEVRVDGFNSKIANEKLDTIGNVFDNIQIKDIVAEDERTGIFAILDPETPINGIAVEINDSIMGSPMQFFMNEGLISFENEDPDSSDPSTADILDGISYVEEDYTLISASNPDYAKYYEGNGTWEKDGDNYKIPTWRTKPLNESFSYIVLLLAGHS